MTERCGNCRHYGGRRYGLVYRAWCRVLLQDRLSCQRPCPRWERREARRDKDPAV